MSEARIGWGGEFQLSSSDAVGDLVEIGEVVSFGLPDDQLDEVEVTLNYVPGSASDIMIRAAKEAGDVRAVRFIIPDTDGTPAWQITTSGFVKGYARGPISAGDKIEATLRIRITGAQTEAAEAGEATS